MVYQAAQNEDYDGINRNGSNNDRMMNINEVSIECYKKLKFF